VNIGTGNNAHKGGHQGGNVMAGIGHIFFIAIFLSSRDSKTPQMTCVNLHLAILLGNRHQSFAALQNVI